MALPRPGIGGQFGAGRIGRGLFRKGGRFVQPRFQFVPDWEKNTLQEVRVPGDKFAKQVHQGMADAMAQNSHRAPGGGSERNDEGWSAGIGSPPNTHTHWHLLEFGGGFHYARGSVRRALIGMGDFKPSGRPT